MARRLCFWDASRYISHFQDDLFSCRCMRFPVVAVPEHTKSHATNIGRPEDFKGCCSLYKEIGLVTPVLCGQMLAFKEFEPEVNVFKDFDAE